MSDAIFRSTEQALHVSYLVLSMPPRQGAPFRNMLIRMLEDLDHPTDKQQAWLDQLRGTAGGGTVNFGGLSPDEIRAQCSMVTAAVRDRLPSQEMAAIWARFAVGDEKVGGMKRLALFARRSCGLTATTLLFDLTARHYLPRDRKEGYTFRAIAEKHQVSKDQVFRAAKWMDAHYRALENLALARLEPKFVAHGLVEDRTACDEPEALAA
ncbi:hypothetical protein J5T34_03755 [Cupriavidus gilardii]|uniref:hypothetical protein n=1 Tax=Cupriavidus gilardii TaxID=82541 RepID=UPI001ABE5869|nr:hypothetical protein [Cupriavidus gilardii]MBO4119854.1 hypothetical protein [Cupriavidus gilardii]